MKGKSGGPLKRTVEVTGTTVSMTYVTHETIVRVKKSTVKAIICSTEQASTSTCFSTLRRRFGKSRKEIVVDGFDEEAIRRKIHSMYSRKEHVTLQKLLVSPT